MMNQEKIDQNNEVIKDITLFLSISQNTWSCYHASVFWTKSDRLLNRLNINERQLEVTRLAVKFYVQFFRFSSIFFSAQNVWSCYYAE